jgi:uncharacterized C2H2 Zn-finger protein
MLLLITYNNIWLRCPQKIVFRKDYVRFIYKSTIIYKL